MKKNIRFIYFYTLILSEYQKNKINILRENNFFEFKSYYILKNKKIKNIKKYKFIVKYLEKILDCEINFNKKKYLEKKILLNYEIKNFDLEEKIIIDVEFGENIKKEKSDFFIYPKIFVILIMFEKIKKTKYFISLKNKKFKNLYLKIVVDVIYLIIFSGSFIFNFIEIEEKEYLDIFLEKTEKYFLFVNSNNFCDFSKINFEGLKEAQSYINLFKKALNDGCFYCGKNFKFYFNKKNMAKKIEEIKKLKENIDFEKINI